MAASERQEQFAYAEILEWAGEVTLAKASASPADSSPPTASDPFDPLRERGINETVWVRRGYVPYYGKRHPSFDPDNIAAAIADYDLSRNQKSFYTRFTNAARNAPPPKQSADLRVDRQAHEGLGQGLLMPKYPVPVAVDAAHTEATFAAPVLPQLRPEYAVETDKRGKPHRHDRAFAGKPEDLVRHLEQEHPGEDVAHNQKHSHPAVAKYLIAPLAREKRTHKHDDDPVFSGPKGAQKLKDHLRSRRFTHKAETVHGWHEHSREVAGQHVADRLDIHPVALEHLATARRVYFSIEGTPKADAILTKILRDDLRASVFDVPSVTLWKAPELKEFARLSLTYWVDGSEVGRKLVVIVADADWHQNERVLRQALLCREYLRKHARVHACIAAPPYRDGEDFIKGVDDFLAAGGALDDLEVLDREADLPLALYANDDGRIRSSLWGLRPLLGVRRAAANIVAAVRDHEQRGVVEITEGSLATAFDDWSECEDWADAPTITIASEHRRASPDPIVRLGDYTPSVTPKTWADVLREELFNAPGAPVLTTSGRARAIRATANRVGRTEKSVREDQWTKNLARTQEQVIAACLAHAPADVPMTKISGLLGVPEKTLRRIREKGAPSVANPQVEEIVELFLEQLGILHAGDG